MRKRRISLLLALMLLFLPVHTLARTEPLETDAPFEWNAKSVLLIDAATGTVIMEKNADEQLPAASITKLMTILLVMEEMERGSIAADTEVTVSAQAAGMGGSQALLDAGGVYTVGDLLKSMIVASANDSAVALAELLSGSEEAFAGRMNERARQLGLTGTKYINATGLPAEGQHTTARDIALLSQEVLSYPVYFEYSGIWMDEIKHKNDRVTELVNTNRLVRFYEGADGVKTGSTNEAGYCISATAKRGEDRFIAVVLGADSGKNRFALAQKMLDHAFCHYTTRKMIGQGDLIEQKLPVNGSMVENVPLAASQDVHLTVKKEDENKINTIVNLPQTVQAPLMTGEKVGEIQFMLRDDVLYSVDIVAAEDAKKADIFGNMVRILRGWMKG